jgi:hypothetical protein
VDAWSIIPVFLQEEEIWTYTKRSHKCTQNEERPLFRNMEKSGTYKPYDALEITKLVDFDLEFLASTNVRKYIFVIV